MVFQWWCHDIGREQAANRPLLKTVFQPPENKDPLKYLEPILRDDIQKIWNVVSKPAARKDTPLGEFFSVAELRQLFSNSISPGGLAGDRQGVVPASGFSLSAQQIWKVIKENKDLDLPAHKVMVAAVRCEEITNEKFCCLSSDADWLAWEEAVQFGSESGFGRKLSSILETYFSEYDSEAIYFDEGVRNAKPNNWRLEDLKSGLEQMLKEGEGFAASAHACTRSCMLEFDQGYTAIRRANWDASKVTEKLRRDIDAHKSPVCNAKLSESVARYEASIRKLLTRETENAVSKFSTAVSSFELDQPSMESMLQGLRDYARNLVVKKANEQAGKVPIIMKDRFSTVFSHDSYLMPRVWTGIEDIKVLFTLE
ncbi:Protein ROOT HAIR DEFECTIVE 3-like protein 2 [Hibiscus syriacus]|uniref:Protein ROOT HAIR DEFECTIVE 3-like protein 2 n=1 Tax=Hibiscus syriacus TaxID=106335 RepID=A0A6A2ZY86_HIBSY|nr:Protein ROOT HAIR DEFECTIVE 3-like protein 2 [Hibiscus syriacus]